MGKMGKVIVPYVGMERIIEFLGAIHKRGTNEITISELASLLGCGVSNISNVSPTLNLLGFANVKGGVISITNNGMEFINAYNSGKTEKAKEMIKKEAEQSSVLGFVKSLLETRVQLTGEEIGRTISDRFGKHWKNFGTYRTVGNSCASILNFAGFGFYHDGVLSLKPMTMKAEAEMYAPEVGFQPIITLLNILHPFERVKISDLVKKLKGIKESRIGKELPVCVALRLVEKDTASSYGITEMGRKLIDPVLSSRQKAQVFRDCLLNSPYVEIISKLSKTDKDLTYDEIGKTLAFELKRDWAPYTKKSYGKKFITWLNGAELVKKIKPGRYKLIDEIKEGTKIQREDSTQIFDISKIYEVGRLLGYLEALIPSEENRKEFEDKLSVLKSILKDYINLELAYDFLIKNFQLSLEAKNPNIYRTNMELVRNKVKDKLGISID